MNSFKVKKILHDNFAIISEHNYKTRKDAEKFIEQINHFVYQHTQLEYEVSSLTEQMAEAHRIQKKNETLTEKIKSVEKENDKFLRKLRKHGIEY